MLLMCVGTTAQPKPKCIAFLGDSNTWTGHDDCSGPKAWSYHLVRNLNPDSCRSFARSGATWTNNAATVADLQHYSEVLDDRNVLYNQVLRLVKAVDEGSFSTPDFIFLCAGTNDAWFAKRRPGIWTENVEQAFARPLPTSLKPSEAVSLASSARLVLSMLRERFPDARIIVVGSPYTVRASREAIDRVVDTLQQVCMRQGVECIRIERTCGIDPEKERKNFDLTVDGTHTSTKGAWQIANCVYNTLAFKNWL